MLFTPMRFSTPKGYRQLRAAVELTLECGHLSATKELFPEVARICETTPSCVDKNLRGQRDHCLRSNRCRAMLLEVFPCLGLSEERPGGGGFVDMMAEYVREMRKRKPRA